MRDIEGYANRLRDRVGDNPGRGGAASGLVGAASGLAGGSFAQRLRGSEVGGSEDFMAEVRERLDLIEGRLAQLEGEMQSLLEVGASENLEEPGSGSDPYSDR